MQMIAKRGKRIVARRKYRPVRFFLQGIMGVAFCKGTELSTCLLLGAISGGDGDGGGVNMKQKRATRKKERQVSELSLAG